ncbi:hypothetical protein [Nocardioides daphniae]|uniref:Uncharacterized protein n=1 Tax=Nocardioides daphniae TaxID=402297 RepID=A0A4P7UDI3_9ACTN|nr:hypothetical protein [Nocardioides daphniae]QCC78313.1 hypothetical protein E2C04_15955 [Nocardioides daphniae]GGD13640.1 hypothetical protein GCM10007231_10880 [Nocardioides daphniae]
MRTFLAVRRLDNGWWIGAMAASWLALALFNWAALPLMFPFEDPRTFVSSGTVVGLVLPLAMMSAVLVEGPPALVATSSRSLGVSRGAWSLGYVLVSGALAALVAASFGLPVGILTSDALLVATLNVVGVALLGVARGWVAGATVVLLMSVPGLVPWSANWAYRVDRAAGVLAVAALVGIVAIALFIRFGAMGARQQAARLGTTAEQIDLVG